MIQLDIKQEVREAMREELDRRDQRIIQAIDDIGKPEYIDRKEAAEKFLGYKSLDSVTNWVREHDVHHFYNGHKIMISRKDLIEKIRKS